MEKLFSLVRLEAALTLCNFSGQVFDTQMASQKEMIRNALDGFATPSRP